MREKKYIKENNNSDSKYSKSKHSAKKYSDNKHSDNKYSKSKYAENKNSDDKKTFIKRPPKKKTSNTKPNNDDGLIRLNKYIAHAGICSRREADKFIETGLISVNGKIITEMGVKVSPTDEIKCNGEKIKSERKVYVLLNKPKDYITTLDDPFAKRTVMDLISGACKERIYPVGRLDRNTTGVLLLTNDGDLTTRLTHPKYKHKKIYHVFLDKKIQRADMQKIIEGIELEDGYIKADAIDYTDETDKKQVGIEIHTGQNKIVRRIFEYLEYKVVKLDRVYFAGLTKKNLQRGHWRFLTDLEVSKLKMNSFE